MTSTAALSPAATLALSAWNGATPQSFARRTGMSVSAVAQHMAQTSGQRTVNLTATKAGMRELLAAGLIEKGDAAGAYRPTA